jgi:hypothetical protein
LSFSKNSEILKNTLHGHPFFLQNPFLCHGDFSIGCGAQLVYNQLPQKLVDEKSSPFVAQKSPLSFISHNVAQKSPLSFISHKMAWAAFRGYPILFPLCQGEWQLWWQPKAIILDGSDLGYSM